MQRVGPAIQMEKGGIRKALCLILRQHLRSPPLASGIGHVLDVLTDVFQAIDDVRGLADVFTPLRAPLPLVAGPRPLGQQILE